MISLTSIVETENSDGDDSDIEECNHELMAFFRFSNEQRYLLLFGDALQDVPPMMNNTLFVLSRVYWRKSVDGMRDLRRLRIDSGAKWANLLMVSGEKTKVSFSSFQVIQRRQQQGRE